MSAGQLDQRITLQRPVDEQTGRGEPVDRWETFATVFASVKAEPPGTPETYAEEQYQSRDRQVFKIRWRPDVDSTCRIVWEGKVYQVELATRLGRRDKLRIIAEGRGAFRVRG